MNNKIIQDLLKRTNTNPRDGVDRQVLSWLDKNKDGQCFHAEHKEVIAASQSALYRSVYRLAAQQRIGFASSRYHNIKKLVRSFNPGTKVLFWHIAADISADALPEWIGESAPLEQGRLFGKDLASLSSEQLQNLIDEAKKIQIKRGTDRRYACLSPEYRQKLSEIFGRIGITDPVYYAHSDDDISFLTYTAVPSMPIDIVIDIGHGPVRHQCKNLTIFGRAIVAATDSMFGSDGEQ